MVRTVGRVGTAIAAVAWFTVLVVVLGTILLLKGCGRVVQRLRRRPPVPVPPIDDRLLVPRPAPAKISAVPLPCRWCGRTTFHLRRRSAFVCEFQAEHHATEAYRMLAAAMPHADLFPGCVCAPGERTLFEGKPDPFCFALEHRP
ncbi:MAG TPA: hypothetical protein VM364_00605 [Vicinamibacterales bacterium]|nr:hypothetical protein [Vicinamibacterales bacterium]